MRFESLTPDQQRVLAARLSALLESITAALGDLAQLHPGHFLRVRALQEEIRAFLRLAALLGEEETGPEEGGEAGTSS